MKNIFKIHPFFYIFAFICILTGYFKNFIIIISIILFHELGHILTAIYFKWKIEKIVILPFGCITIFNEKINKPIKEELLIAISGPLLQCLLFFIMKEYYLYNLILLLFNLLPIFPLDGSKILNLLMNKFVNFKNSHIISIVISFIFLSVFLILKFNLIIFISFICLLIKTIKELKNHKYLFNKFLFERYLYNFNFKKRKIIKNSYQMMRDYKHLFLIDNKYITEQVFLLDLFDN